MGSNAAAILAFLILTNTFMKRTLTAEDIAAGVERLAVAIREKNPDQPIALVGIRSRGDEVAERVLTLLSSEDRELSFGVLDISLYRDDFEHLRENPSIQESQISFPVEGAHIILVDDVLFTGRTIRAAIDALLEYGRPARVQLAVLVDRGHRELPIRPDYVGKNVPTSLAERVRVELGETDEADRVVLLDGGARV